MVARRSQNKKMREREDLVRRSPDISDGAKLLWIELQRGWAWDDLTCDPAQETLAFALGWSIRRVKRRLAELVGHGLVIVERNDIHTRNSYTLAEKIPEDLCDPKRLINRILLQLKREMMEKQGTDLSRALANLDKQGTELSRGTGQNCPVAGDETVPWQGTEVSRKDELHQDELIEDELLKKQPQKRLQSSNSDSSSEASKNQEEPANFSDEVDDPIPMVESDSGKKRRRCSICKEPGHNSRSCSKKATRGKRASTLLEFEDKSLVTKTTPAVPSDNYEQAKPPPPKTPDDLLELLRSEVVEKYGAGEAKKIPYELTGEETGKLRNIILTKYDPDVVIDMIRVLVWDWEVVRNTWPPRPEDKLPKVSAIWVYHETLSSATGVGFPRTGSQRGGRNTYAARYLNKGGPSIQDDLPF